MKSLMRPGTGDQVLWMMPSVGVAVLHRPRDDAQRNEVVDLLELDLLFLQLLPDAVETLDATVDPDEQDLRLAQLRANGLLELLDEPFRNAAPRLDAAAQRLVAFRLEVAETELLELVLHLAHPQPVGDGGVDVERLLRDLDPAILGQVVQRPHVVKPVGQLHEDDPDVIHHRQQHLAEVLGLPLLARRERDGADLGHALDDVRDLGAEQLLDALDGGQGVLDDVVEEAGGDGDRVQPQVGQEVGDLKRVHHVGLARMAHLSLVLEGREDVGAAEQLEVGLGVVRPDLFEQVLEANHRERCLTGEGEALLVMISGGSGGSKAGGEPTAPA